jgi:hypothetical protein
MTTQVKERAVAALDLVVAELLKATKQKARVVFAVPKLATLRKQLIDDELCELDVILLTRFFDAWFTGIGDAHGIAQEIIADRGVILGGHLVGAIKRIVEIPRNACVGAPMGVTQFKVDRSQANIDLQAELAAGPPGCGQR